MMWIKESLTVQTVKAVRRTLITATLQIHGKTTARVVWAAVEEL